MRRLKESVCRELNDLMNDLTLIKLLYICGAIAILMMLLLPVVTAHIN